jgi:hypothetical protein
VATEAPNRSRLGPDRIAHPLPVLVERPSAFDDESAVGAGVRQAPQRVRERDGIHPWQPTLPLESAAEIEQATVAVLLARTQSLVNLGVLPSGHDEGLVDLPDLGGDFEVRGDRGVEGVRRGRRLCDRMPGDGRDDVRCIDVQVKGGQQLCLGREIQVDRLA